VRDDRRQPVSQLLGPRAMLAELLGQPHRAHERTEQTR